MNLTIELPDELAAALEASAHIQGVSPSRYILRVLEGTLTREAQSPKAVEPFETGYAMWASYGPAPSMDEIEQNRHEMFRAFAKDE